MCCAVSALVPSLHAPVLDLQQQTEDLPLGEVGRRQERIAALALEDLLEVERVLVLEEGELTDALDLRRQLGDRHARQTGRRFRILHDEARLLLGHRQARPTDRRVAGGRRDDLVAVGGQEAVEVAVGQELISRVERGDRELRAGREDDGHRLLHDGRGRVDGRLVPARAARCGGRRRLDRDARRVRSDLGRLVPARLALPRRRTVADRGRLGHRRRIRIPADARRLIRRVAQRFRDRRAAHRRRVPAPLLRRRVALLIAADRSDVIAADKRLLTLLALLGRDRIGHAPLLALEIGEPHRVRVARRLALGPVLLLERVDPVRVVDAAVESSLLVLGLALGDLLRLGRLLERIRRVGVRELVQQMLGRRVYIVSRVER